VQTRDLHVALSGRRGERPQLVGHKVRVCFEAAEAKVAVLLEKALWAVAWAVPRRRQSDWFAHG
jgi:transposase